MQWVQSLLYVLYVPILLLVADLTDEVSFSKTMQPYELREWWYGEVTLCTKLVSLKQITKEEDKDRLFVSMSSLSVVIYARTTKWAWRTCRPNLVNPSGHPAGKWQRTWVPDLTFRVTSPYSKQSICLVGTFWATRDSLHYAQLHNTQAANGSDHAPCILQCKKN